MQALSDPKFKLMLMAQFYPILRIVYINHTITQIHLSIILLRISVQSYSVHDQSTCNATGRPSHYNKALKAEIEIDQSNAIDTAKKSVTARVIQKI